MESVSAAEDTPEKLDYERMARVVEGLVAAIADLAGIASGTHAAAVAAA